MSEAKLKFLRNLAILLLVLGLICVGYVLLRKKVKKSVVKLKEDTSCVKAPVPKLVEDEFMSGVFEKGDTVNVLEKYYDCNTPQNGDIAYYQFSANIPPVVRFVRGVPGDRYTLKPIEGKTGLWTISINDEQVRLGSENYFIESNSVPPLRTYELSRQGVLRQDEFILLGNKSPSISDSSNLGLINKKDLVGKIAGKIATEK